MCPQIGRARQTYADLEEEKKRAAEAAERAEKASDRINRIYGIVGKCNTNRMSILLDFLAGKTRK